jgi:hypothetical protein
MRQPLLAASLLVALAAVGAAPQASAQSAGRTGITGRVLGPDGKPVGGAWVSLQSSDGNKPRTTQTNAQGQFSFLLDSGAYDLRAHADTGRSAWRRNVRVVRRKKTDVALRLEPKSPAAVQPGFTPARLPSPTSPAAP